MMNRLCKYSAALTLAVLTAAPLTTFADGPTSRPVNRPGGDRSERRGPMRPNASRTPVTNEQWDTIVAFMREHSERRIDELQDLISAADEKKANFFKSLVAAQYDYVMSLKTEDPDLYDLQIRKIESQDVIYGMLKDSKKGMNEEQKKAFRDEVTKLVDVNFAERTHRIEKAKESLEKAKSSLEADQKNKDSLVDDRVNQFMKEGPRPFKMDGPNAAPPSPGDARPGDQSNATPKISHDQFADAEQQMNSILMDALTK